MKVLLVLTVLIFLSITSCTSTLEIDFTKDLHDTWSLVNISSGWSNCSFTENEILWAFTDSGIEIANNSTQEGACDLSLQESSTYDVNEAEGKFYLHNNENASGLITIEGDNMIINSNNTVNGTAVDGIIHYFHR